MTRDDIIVEIRAALARVTEQDASRIPLDCNLAETIGLDSLSRLEILSEVEERFDLTIYEADSDMSVTIAGMADIVETAIAQEPASA